MESIRCIQGQGGGSRGLPILIPISEGIPQDVLQTFGVWESQEDPQPLHLAPAWEQLIPLFSGELRDFLPACLGDLDWSSRERSLSGCLVESSVSGYCQGHSCPITSTERLYMVQVSTTRRSTKTKDSNNYLDTNVWDRRSN